MSLRRPLMYLEWALFSVALVFVLGFGAAVFFGLYEYWYLAGTTFEKLVELPLPYSMLLAILLGVALVASVGYAWLVARRRGAPQRWIPGAVLAGLFAWVLGISVVSGLFAAQFSDAINQRLVAPYRLLAVDTRDQLSVVLDFEDGGAMGLIGPVVVEAGYDDNYVVAAVRPDAERGGNLLYYYLYVSRARQLPLRDDAVVGPLSNEEFQGAKLRLGLPEFTLHFPDLR